MGKKSNVPSASELRKYVEDDIEIDSDADEEIDEDEAFDSEDERKFGQFFKTGKKKKNQEDLMEDSEDESGVSEDESKDESKDELENESENESDDESDDGIASEDDDEEGDGGEYMLSLLDKIDPANKASNTSNKEQSMQLNKDIPESEFSSSVVQSSNLTMDQLMNGISDTKGFSKIQSSMKDMVHPEQAILRDHDAKNKPLMTTLAPVSRIISERTKREVHYKDQKQNVKNWAPVVQENRKAESLDFRPKASDTKINKEDMVSKFEPETDFEKEIHAVLESVGAADESAILKKEEEDWNISKGIDDDLGEGKLTLEQYEKRQGQLAKMRALMFYEEQKRHHINKIKSKKYRKIRKNQRDRLKDADMKDALEAGDDELLKELKEKEEKERMEERMTLAHKNTSKWAKRQLRRGKALDVGTRQALSAQVQKGQDLRNKMKSIRGSNDSDSEGDDDQRMIDKAKAILKQTENDIENEENSKEKKGLFKMSFMQKGLKMQRERAKAEAEKLLEELEGDDDASEDEYDYGDDRANNDWRDDVGDKKKKKEKIASSEEMANVLPTGKLVVSSLEFGKTNSISVDGNIAINLDNAEEDQKVLSSSTGHSEYSTKASLSNTDYNDEDVETDSSNQIKNRKNNKRTASIMEEAKKDASSNPWLNTKNSKKTKTKNEAKNTAQNALIDGYREEPKEMDKSSNSSSAEQKDGKERDTMKLSQEELVRKAFAAPTDVEVEEEFQKEKVSNRIFVHMPCTQTCFHRGSFCL